MTGKQLREALHGDRRVYGTLLVSDSAFWPSVVGMITGLDFVFVDTEHIAIDRVRLSWMCRTYLAMGLPAVVRIPSPDPYRACQVLDDGASGVIAPYVETVEEVKRLVGAVKRRPVKGAKLGDILHGRGPKDGKFPPYLDRFNEENTLVINIESIPAVEALDQLLEVPGLDGVLVGPHDLSCSLELPEEYEDPRFVGAVDEIIGKARRKGIGAGIHMTTPSQSGIAQEIAWARLGANFVVHSADAIAFSTTMERQINQLRDELDDRVEDAHGKINI